MTRNWNEAQQVRLVEVEHVIPHVDEDADGNLTMLDDPLYAYLTVSSDGREYGMELTISKDQAEDLASLLMPEPDVEKPLPTTGKLRKAS